MDSGGLDICILSLTGPGVQAVPNITQAIAQARRTNDYLAENVAKNPKRLKGFATLPLQDPEAAAKELTRCVRDLGFCGALVNGFSQVGEARIQLFSMICRNTVRSGQQSRNSMYRSTFTLGVPWQTGSNLMKDIPGSPARPGDLAPKHPFTRSV